MKKLLFVLGLLFFVQSALFAQAKKPIIMVVPSDNWCHQNGYMQHMDFNGSSEDFPDYQKALTEDADLLLMISKINELMTERDFPLKNLESALKTLKVEEAEAAATESRNGSALKNESRRDKLNRVAHADIIIQLTWSINKIGPKRSVTYNVQGLDAYTNKQIAGASGTSEQAFISNSEVSTLLVNALLLDWENFVYQLQSHFDRLQETGREIAASVKPFETLEDGLETEIGGMELTEIIENWVADNTQSGRFSLVYASENKMDFEQVMIPLYNDNGRAIDARAWMRELQKYLRKQYQLESKLFMRGLGYAELVIGEK